MIRSLYKTVVAPSRFPPSPAAFRNNTRARTRRNRVHERIVNCCGRFVGEARTKMRYRVRWRIVWRIYANRERERERESAWQFRRTPNENKCGRRKRIIDIARSHFLHQPCEFDIHLPDLLRIIRDSQSHNWITWIVQSSYNVWVRFVDGDEDPGSTTSRQRLSPSSFPTRITRSNFSTFLCHLLRGSAGS